ncbi:MAG TPA: hypothetical protein VNA14_11915 [Mycobacteriales bacterium]|nr:hypothetical protein [Mycobacteriales bacterium]
MTTAEPVLRPTSATDTTPEWGGVAEARRGRAARRVLLAVFAAFLALGATGMLGVREGTATASGGGYDLSVTYPRITRAGHAVPFAIEVRKPGGFGDEPITLSLSSSYFALFDENGVQPSPSKETATGEDLIWEFDPPPGDTLRIYFDTRTGPNRQRGARGVFAVRDGDVPVALVRIRTVVLP